MDQISEGRDDSMEIVWIKPEPSDPFFDIKSEDDVGTVPITRSTVPSNIKVEFEAVNIKSEITLGDFECIPSSIPSSESTSTAPLQLRNNVKLAKKSGKNVFGCVECGKKFDRKDSLARHERFHSGEKPYACDECGLRFAQKCHIKPHKRTHSGEKPFSCDLCSSKFSTHYSLKQHNILLHRIGGSIRTNKQKCYSVESGATFTKRVVFQLPQETFNDEHLYSCDECEKKFNRKDSLTRHKRSHSGDRPYKCSECHMRFFQSAHLKSHKLSHIGKRSVLNTQKKVHTTEANVGTEQQKVTTNSEITLNDVESVPVSSISLQLKNDEKFGLFGCEECGKKFNSTSSLNRHVSLHCDKKPLINVNEQRFSSVEAEAKFTGRLDLQLHQETRTDVHLLSCDVCGKKFKNKVSLNRHVSLHCDKKPLINVNEHKFSSVEAEAKFTGRMDLQLHQETRTDVHLFSCDVCGKKFKKKVSLNRHVSLHCDKKPLINVNEQRFSSVEAEGKFTGRLDLHQETRTDLHLFSCDVCGKKFKNTWSLKRHKLCHSFKKSFACNLCDSSFTLNCYLQYHMRSHTGEKPFRCEECGKEFSRKQTLDRHQLSHTGEKKFVCEKCGKAFVSHTLWYSHLRSHSGEKHIKCDICGIKFFRKERIRQHMRTHTGERPFECGDCGKKFGQIGTLKAHKTTHSGAKPFQCDECDLKFSSKNLLSSHKLRHTGERRFPCDQCDKKFTKKCHLMTHKIQHTGERPFACDECDMRFSIKFYLKSHKLKHAGVKPFECDECDKKFYTRNHLNQHKRVHTRAVCESKTLGGGGGSEFIKSQRRLKSARI